MFIKTQWVVVGVQITKWKHYVQQVFCFKVEQKSFIFLFVFWLKFYKKIQIFNKKSMENV